MPTIASANAATKQEIRDVSSITVFATFTGGDTTPSVLAGGTFKTNNSIPVTITDFDNGYDAQRIVIVIDDAFTTIDFSASNLIGNGGADWEPALGDSFTAVFDGTFWYCQISAGDHTNLSNIGSNTHAQIDTHISDATLHYTQSEILISTSQLTDYVEGSGNNWLVANAGANFTVTPISLTDSIAAGEGSETVSEVAIALGKYASAKGQGSVAIGWSATTITTNVGVPSNIAIGTDALASGDSAATAIGDNSTASGDTAVAIGAYTLSQGDYSTTIGNNCTALGDYSIAIGNNSDTELDNQISIGYNLNELDVSPDVAHSVRIGSDSGVDTNIIYLHSKGKFTLIGDEAQYVLPNYTVATAPTGVAGGTIYVSDETGGAVLAFSDGTNWRRVTDRAIIS